MKKIFILPLGFAIVLGACSRPLRQSPSVQGDAPAESEYARGKAEAHADLKGGRPRYFYVSQPISADSQLVDILRKDYVVALVQLGCQAVPPVAEHAKGYNDIVSEVLGKRFGTDFIKRAWEKDHELREQIRKDEGSIKELKATR